MSGSDQQSWQDRVATFIDGGRGCVSIEGIMCHLGGLASRQLPSRRVVAAFLREKGWRSRRDARGHMAWDRPPAVRPDNWALETEIKPGDRLVADSGFDCIASGAILTVERKPGSEDLFVRCRDGQHMLDGQLGEHGRYVGFAKVEAGQ